MSISFKKFEDSDMVVMAESKNACGTVKNYFDAMVKFKLSPKNIAVDQDAGDAMFKMREYVRSDESNDRFLVFFSGNFYEVIFHNSFTDVVEVKSFDSSKIEVTDALKNFLRSAFDVYGRYGLESNSFLRANEPKVELIFKDSE